MSTGSTDIDSRVHVNTTSLSSQIEIELHEDAFRP